ncbi:hypothetical protein Pcinc_000502 [Petrolisthes cinctipes]|uniref:DUF5641 domain-containing protein n=1 Tax=Petrolisthes cinctipes TaxID=88211 RepID=A0AAE1GQ16_PETCI|nr:hypothetical protein Pcinc_000502 [Petrolisthes cinctipes]
MLGKCRVVPFKPVLSIPRLELIAAVLSVQLATKLRKELPLRAKYPSDDGSRAVWSVRWLKGPNFLKIPDLITEHINPVVAPDDVEVKCLSSFGDEHQVVVQGLHFAKELGALSSQNAVCRGSPLFKLDVFLDEDGLIRVGGRIRQSSLSDDVKHPVVLPSNHGLSRLIIQHFHQNTHHQGRGITCSEVCSHGFWILSLHRLVKRLIHSCAICSRLRGRPVEQKMADLPEDRLSPCSPFWFSGCDLFGPYVVKSGRRECKRYGVMFTCLVSRAVHIEVVHSLTTDSFLNAFRRFVALRGSVREIRCDQDTNLVGARNDLMKMGCDMVFNPPSSSHRGGVWERMIGVARRIIEGILVEHGSRLDDEGLMTVLSEAASVINSRPLSVDNISDPQSLEPLTPNHLITMKSRVIPRTIAPLNAERPDLYASKQWRRVQHLVDLFWSRWKREIAQQYMPRTKWNTPRQNLKVGDLVLIIDKCHRSFWRLARVNEVDTSQDGLVRSVKEQLADRSILHRPVQKLIRLFN